MRTSVKAASRADPVANEPIPLAAASRGDRELSSLVSVAVALVGADAITTQERALLQSDLFPIAPRALSDLRNRIAAGEDALGDEYCRLRTAEQRRPFGQTFTPPEIIKAMLDWSADQTKDYVRIVDPGAGTGRFTFAALERFPKAQAVCIEVDPVVALLLRATAAARGASKRVFVVVDDFRHCQLSRVAGRTLFLGNPPYVRHHDIPPHWKLWYSTRLQRLGHNASQLAGLHLHFFLKTLELANRGDEACYVTAAEWMDVNYGQALRDLLTNCLGGKAVFAVAPEVQVFDDALASAAITCFSPGRAAKRIIFNRVSRESDLKRLRIGRSVPLAEAKANPRWSSLTRVTAGDYEQHVTAGLVPLGDLFRVQRGQVTGANSVWVVPPDAPALPERFLVPCITRAKDLFKLRDSRVTDANSLRQVADLPETLEDLPTADRQAVESFIAWAAARGAANGYIARHRRPWWRVRLKEPAPIVMTYMGRRPPVFALNSAGARLINIAHGLYPRQTLPAEYLDKIVEWLNANVSIAEGRSYAGGLVKFEPSEVMRLRIPPVKLLLVGRVDARNSRPRT